MKVQDILTDESKWCRKMLKNGRGQRCLLGAIEHAYFPGDNMQSWRALENSGILKRVRERIGQPSVSAWNDDHTFAEVRGLIEELDI